MPRQDYDPQQLGPAVYALLNSVVVPRPIAWVGTRSRDGVDNLAPHSFFTISSVQPPVVQFTSVGTKDSLTHARDTGEFTISLCPEPLLVQVNTTATDYPRGTSEFDEAGLTRLPSKVVAAPAVAESPVSIECRVVGTRDFGGDSTVVFGEVVWLTVDDDVLLDGRPEITLLRPLARLGAQEWATIGDVVKRRRIAFSELSS